MTQSVLPLPLPRRMLARSVAQGATATRGSHAISDEGAPSRSVGICRIHRIVSIAGKTGIAGTARMTGISRLARITGLTTALACATLLGGCGKQGATLGEGGSEISGSAGPAGANKANRELLKCDAPVATLALVENPNGYTVTGAQNLPNTPLPLVRLLAQQSGCFRVVDRNAGLRATIKEQELKDAGVLRKEGSTVAKGKGYEAQYTLTPSLTFSEQDAGRQVGGILAMIPGLARFVGAAEHVKLKEAQVALPLTDNETTEQVAAATGSVRVTDLGMGGLVLGKLGGAAGAGWANSNEAKVIAAAFLDAHNQLVVQARALAAKDLPEPVPTRKAKTALTGTAS